MVNLLTEIFPSVAENTLNEYASNSLDINEAVNDIADFMKDNAEQIPNISENKKKRLIIDEENVLQDCLSYYKRQDFDAKLALRIVFDGQTAVDAGGPLRHFFTLVSKEMSQNFFEGNPTNLVPKIDANTCLSEIFIVLGKIIAHNIAHGCNGFPYLSASNFYYICSGSIKDAALHVTLDQVASHQYLYFVKKVYIICNLFL